MNFKKIAMMFLMFILVVSGANAVIELTACGKSSGWVNGETYILNFSTIPASYGGTSCFTFENNLDHNDISFVGVGDIDIQKDLNYFFTNAYLSSSINLNNLSFENISLISTTNNVLTNFLYINSNYNRDLNFEYNQFNNFTSKIQMNSLIYGHSRNSGSSIIPSGRVNFKYNVLNDLDIINVNYLFETLKEGGATSSEAYTIQNWNNFTNSYINMNKFSFNTGGVYCQIIQNHIYDSVFISSDLSDNYGRDVTYTDNTASHSYFYNSLLGHVYFTDVDNNNIGDSPTSFDTNPKIVVQLNEFNFFQDFEEGDGIYNNYANNDFVNVYINPETIPNAIIGGAITNPNGELNEFFDTLIIDDITGFIINGGIDCSLVSSELCYIQDSPTLTTISSTIYKPLLSIGQGLINGINISKVGSNNAIILGNVFDQYFSGINISNSYLSKSDNNFKYNNNYFIKLKANDILINSNYFTATNSLNGAYEFLDITSTTPTTNIVTLNRFEFIDNFGTVDRSEIFTNNGATTFFNNYVGNDIDIAGSITANLNINVRTSILYNNNIYYFDIGNYYEENTGCIDLDNNDICDSPYTNGAYTDDYPLAVYPFDYLANLGNAVLVVPNNPFNITVLGLTQNESVELATDTTGILFQFQQDSTFIDLVCDFVLDGSTVSTYNYPTQNEIIDYTHFGIWTEKQYSFRVDCVNEFQTISSEEYLFNVTFTTAPPENNVSNGIVIDTSGVDFDIIGSTSGETTDNIQGMYSLMSEPLGWLLIIGIVLLVLATIGFLFGLLRYMIR